MPVKCPQCGKMHETLEEMREKAMIGSAAPNPEPIPHKFRLKRKTSESDF